MNTESTILKALYTALLTVLISVNQANAQQQINFSYDAAGNQTERTWICVNCTGPVAEQPNLDKLLLKSDTTTTQIALSAFPNPVEEVLNLTWANTSKGFLKKVEIYSLSGLRVFYKEYSSTESSAQIPFTGIPAAGYLLRAYYSDGTKSVLKLIKH